MSNGVPFDVAFMLDELTVAAWTIVFGEIQGGKFDWRNMSWEEVE